MTGKANLKSQDYEPNLVLRRANKKILYIVTWVRRTCNSI